MGKINWNESGIARLLLSLRLKGDNIAQISRRSKLTYSYTSNNVRKLLDEGYIEDIEHKSAREHRVRLTFKGMKTKELLIKLEMVMGE